MNFKDAVKELKKGKRIRRNSWSNKDFSLPISKEEEDEGIPYLTFQDLEANDWEIYKKKKYCKYCKQEIK